MVFVSPLTLIKCFYMLNVSEFPFGRAFTQTLYGAGLVLIDTIYSVY